MSHSQVHRLIFFSFSLWDSCFSLPNEYFVSGWYKLLQWEELRCYSVEIIGQKPVIRIKNTKYYLKVKPPWNWMIPSPAESLVVHPVTAFRKCSIWWLVWKTTNSNNQIVWKRFRFLINVTVPKGQWNSESRKKIKRNWMQNPVRPTCQRCNLMNTWKNFRRSGYIVKLIVSLPLLLLYIWVVCAKKKIIELRNIVNFNSTKLCEEHNCYTILAVH